MNYFKVIVLMQNSVFLTFISFYSFYQTTRTSVLPITQSRNIVSETSTQYVLQSEMGKSNNIQYSGLFKVIGNYTAGCVIF